MPCELLAGAASCLLAAKQDFVWFRGVEEGAWAKFGEWGAKEKC